MPQPVTAVTVPDGRLVYLILNGNHAEPTLRRDTMTKTFAKLIRDESGAAAIEYGLIAGLIAVVIIAGATSLGGTLNGLFNTVSTTLSGVGTP